MSEFYINFLGDKLGEFLGMDLNGTRDSTTSVVIDSGFKEEVRFGGRSLQQGRSSLT